MEEENEIFEEDADFFKEEWIPRNKRDIDFLGMPLGTALQKLRSKDISLTWSPNMPFDL